MQDRRALAALSRRQYAVVTGSQLRACGYSASAEQRLVERGELETLHAGVHRLASAPRCAEQRLIAAVLAAGEGAALSHRSGAWNWAIGEFDDVVEISVTRGRLPRLSGVVVHRSRDLTPAWTVSRRGILTTNPLRTMLDLGAVVSASVLEDCLDRGLSDRLFNVAAIEWAYNELHRPGRNGCGVLRRVLDERALGDDPPDGLLEPRMARLLRAYGLPRAEFQYWVGQHRVDFAYPDDRLVIEVDGYKQRRSAAAMEYDIVRQNELTRLGWRVIRFTWQLVVRNPKYVAGEIAAGLGTDLPAHR